MSIQFTNNVQDLYGTKSFRAHNMKNDFPKRLERHWKLRKTLDRVEKLKKLGMRLRWMLLRRFCLNHATLPRCYKNIKDDTVFRHSRIFEKECISVIKILYMIRFVPFLRCLQYK